MTIKYSELVETFYAIFGLKDGWGIVYSENDINEWMKQDQQEEGYIIEPFKLVR
jgi:hypothetical protein